MLGMTLNFAEDERATPTLDEAVRVARDAGITAALALGLSTLAAQLPIEEVDRAVALLDEAAELGRRTDDRLAVSTAVMARGSLLGRLGNWRAALRAQADAAEQKLVVGDIMSIPGCFWWASIALCELGHLEVAAALLGKGDAMSGRYGAQWWLDLRAATDNALLAALGEQQVMALRAWGAALEIADAVAYLCANADQALATP